MPTIKQKTAFKKTLESIGKPDNISMGKILLDSGYSEAISKNPQMITKSKGWQELLNDIKDDFLLDRLNEMAKDKKDKRAAIQCIDMLLKLKDKYPANKNVNIDILDKRDNIFKPD